MRINRRQVIRSAMIGLPALALGLGPRRARGATPFLAQTARALIVSGQVSPVFITGYGAGPHDCPPSSAPHPGLFTGVVNPIRPPLLARALAIREAENSPPIVFVSADVAGISRAIHDDVAAAVSGLVPADRLAIAASHIHSGPFGTGAIPRIQYPVLETDTSAAAAIAAAEQDLRQTLISLIQMVVAAPAVTVNLRFNGTGTFDAANRVTGCGYPPPREEGEPDGVDRDAPVLVATRTDTHAPFAILFGCASHPLTAMCPLAGQISCGCGQPGEWQQDLHSDFPGVAAFEIERTFPGSTALFLQGCAGDQEPAPVPEVGVARVERLGQALAQTVINSVVAASFDADSCLEGPIRCFGRSVPLPYDLDQTFTSGSASLTVGTEVLRQIYVMLAATSGNAVVRLHAQHIASLPVIPPAMRFRYLVWSFGNRRPFVWCGLPSETVAAYALAIRARFRPRGIRSWVSGYINEVQAYIPSEAILTAPRADCTDDIFVTYTAGWNPRAPVTFSPASGGSFDVTTAVAAGAAHFYGHPSRYGEGIENRILNEIYGIGDLVSAIARSCRDR